MSTDDAIGILFGIGFGIQFLTLFVVFRLYQLVKERQ